MDRGETAHGKQTSWLRQLDGGERSTLIATFSGWMLDGMDVMVYTLVLPTLVVEWHISRGQAGLLGTSALVLSSVGGWLAGLAADKWGRVRVLQCTIVWFAFFTFLSGFTNSFDQLFVVRGLQGLGFGGEWAVGSVLIGEKIRAKWRGRAVGTTQGGWAIGWGIAVLFYTLLFGVLPAHLAWRAMFWIGILPSFLAIWVRHHVDEPHIYTASRATQSNTTANFMAIFAPGMLRVTLLASLTALGAQGGYYAMNTFLPLYLGARGLTVSSTGVFMMVVVAGSFAGYLTSAHLADWIGRRRTLVLFAAGSFLAIALYTIVPVNNTVMLVLGLPLGFFPSGAFSPMGSFFTELFPTALRGSGQGFSYNLGRAAGALFPALVGFTSAHISLGASIAAFALSAYAVMVVGVLLLPETRGIDLHLIDDAVSIPSDVTKLAPTPYSDAMIVDRKIR